MKIQPRVFVRQQEETANIKARLRYLKVKQ